MIDADVIRLIRREIRNHMFIIGHAIAQGGGQTVEDQALEQNYPGGPAMNPRPVSHPYGFVSSAPKGTLAVTARIGEHPGAVITIAHRDPARAEMELAEGDSTLYDEGGQAVGCVGGKTLLGSLQADNPVVLGNELVELLTELVDLIIAGDLALTTSPGNPTAPNPPTVVRFQELKQRLLTNATTNVLSSHVFTEREV